jgi:hypothetical protein
MTTSEQQDRGQHAPAAPSALPHTTGLRGIIEGFREGISMTERDRERSPNSSTAPKTRSLWPVFQPFLSGVILMDGITNLRHDAVSSTIAIAVAVINLLWAVHRQKKGS